MLSENCIINIEIGPDGQIVNIDVPGKQVTTSEAECGIRGPLDSVDRLETVQFLTVTSSNPGRRCCINHGGKLYCFPC